MDPQTFINDDRLMLKLAVVHKLRKLLQKEGRAYRSVLFHRLGTGMSEAEFDFCIKMLEVTRWCTVKKGERNAEILTLNPAFTNTHQEQAL